MDTPDNLKFESTTLGTLTTDEVLASIRDFIKDKPNAKYSMVIGTDSHETIGSSLNNRKIKLVTAVLVHRIGFGGKYFWLKKHTDNIHSLREKIYAETLQSIEFAGTFVPLLQEVLHDQPADYNLEIHIDVGEHGDTREMIKEVVGMVTGSGYVAKTKPEAYGASYVADKHT